MALGGFGVPLTQLHSQTSANLDLCLGEVCPTVCRPKAKEIKRTKSPWEQSWDFVADDSHGPGSSATGVCSADPPPQFMQQIYALTYPHGSQWLVSKNRQPGSSCPLSLSHHQFLPALASAPPFCAIWTGTLTRSDFQKVLALTKHFK